jgi:ketosteroid isomerase-like protein
MDAESAARAWVEGWLRAWPAGDADAVGALYAEGAVFRSHPFREPQPPAEYAAWAFADENEVLAECRFGDPVVDGDRAAVEYWAILRRRDGGEATLAGIAVLRFGADGLVLEQRDYWDLAEGRRPPNFP